MFGRYNAVALLLFISVVVGTQLGLNPIYAGETSHQRLPWEGQALFQDKGCIKCHAIHGKGGDAGPDLGDDEFYGTYLELAALMWNHLPEMLEETQESGYLFPQLNSDEMEQVVVYLCYMRYIPEPGNERTGRKLLKNKKCMSCHRFGGSGGDIGPDIGTRTEYLAPIVLIESMWNHGPDMMELLEEQDIDRPEFDNDEIVDLVAGIRSYMEPTTVPTSAHNLGDPDNGRTLIEEKGCINCHSVRGVGGDLGPDFAELDLDCSATKIAGRMWNHGPKMWEAMKREGMTFTEFEEGEMADIIAYLYGLGLEDEPGDVQKGREFVERRCISCHTLQGKGEGLSPDLANLGQMDSPSELVSAMWNHAPDMRERQQAKKLKWPKINSEDMADLYAFLQTLSPPVESEH
jgi:mono/diheme cytochrome c family protein